MSTDDPKEGESQGNGGQENNRHGFRPGDNGENKNDGGKEGEGGVNKQYTEDEEEPVGDEEPSVMVLPGKSSGKTETYTGNIRPPPTEVYH